MSKCSMAKKIESLTKNEAAGNSVSNFSRNSLGVSFDGKFGTMRKPADWVIYPTKPEDKTFDIQCDNRWATIEKETGKMLLSAPHSFANSWVLANDVRTGKAQRITLEPDVLKQLLDAISDRRITDHSLDKIVRSADVTDAEIRGESKMKKCSMSKRIESLGKKSEVKDNEIPYVMMQYYVPDEKVWEPILVEINSNDTGWFYDGLALMDNLGNFGYDEFSWDFIHHRCKRGTDKCDPELVQSMEKFYLKDFTPDDEYQPRKVDRLGNHIPKGKTYIGKN